MKRLRGTLARMAMMLPWRAHALASATQDARARIMLARVNIASQHSDEVVRAAFAQIEERMRGRQRV